MSAKARQRAAEIGQEKLKECTFHPNTGKPSVHGQYRQPVIPSADLTLHGQACFFRLAGSIAEPS